jgi:hypothetical protein
MKMFSVITFDWFMILNVYYKLGKEEFCGLSEWQKEQVFNTCPHQATKELITQEWYAVSDLNHSSQQQVFYGSLWPTV